MFDAPSFSRNESPPSDNPQRWIIMYKRYLVGGLEYDFYFSIIFMIYTYIYICGIILPIDELIFFNMVIAPPSSNTVLSTNFGSGHFINGNFRILKWRYLPSISIDFSLNSSPIATKWVDLSCQDREQLRQDLEMLLSASAIEWTHGKCTLW